VKNLQLTGATELRSFSGEQALCSYSLALEAEEWNIEIICGHCLAYLLTDQITCAQQDADQVVALAPDDHRVTTNSLISHNDHFSG